MTGSDERLFNKRLFREFLCSELSLDREYLRVILEELNSEKVKKLRKGILLVIGN